jgi:lipoprotein NlpI
MGGEGKDYVQLYLCIIRYRWGDVAGAKRDLASYVGNRKGGDGWIGTVAGYLLGQVTEPELLGAASGSKLPGRVCEGYYYAGMMRYLIGNDDLAAEYFGKCVATGERGYAEYQMAKAQLKAMGGGN